jgi:hypothetical protein
MLHILLQTEFIILLFVLARSADLAITSAIGRSYIRAGCYGFVAILALIVVIFTLVH